jgi:DNA (cytosine-5)-methyltransferase 1
MSNPHAWRLSDLSLVPSNGLTVMSTFCCGGGSSMGYKRAGYKVVAACDIDPEMAYHYKLNINPPLFYLCPIKDLVSMDLPDHLYDLDILDGSPPCSSFSTAGLREKTWGKKKHFREGQSEQVLDDLFFDFLDLVEKLKPKAAIAENVKGMILGKAKGYCRLIMKRFRAIGYNAQLFLLNSANCGVPQARERVFFCALRNDLPFQKLEIKPSFQIVTAGEAICDLNMEHKKKETEPRRMDLKWWHLTKPGENYSVPYKRITGKDGMWSHRKFKQNAPAYTIIASEGFTHWNQCRRFSFLEIKRFGSFPDDYKAKTPEIGKYMVGMSVPPKMTEFVARSVAEQWLSFAQSGNTNLDQSGK